MLSSSPSPRTIRKCIHLSLSMCRVVALLLRRGAAAEWLAAGCQHAAKSCAKSINHPCPGCRVQGLLADVGRAVGFQPLSHRITVA